MRFVHTQNMWLWQHWTVGTPLELESVYAPFEALFSEETWREMRKAPKPTSRAQACALQNLQAFVLGEVLSLGLQQHNLAVALLENNLTVMYQAKDFPWHELGRLLAHEKEAVHRQNLWLYSLQQARPLSEAIHARQQHTTGLLEQLGMDEARAIPLFRGANLEAFSQQLQARLEETQTRWCTHVQAMAAQHNMDKATRADLPFFFQAKLPDGNLYFPAQQQAAVVDATFEKLGLWPTPRLLRLVGKTQAYPALPLALNGGLEKSHLAFFPVQGPHSLRLLLGEMGRALSWTYVHPNQWACRHLGAPVLSNAAALLFSQLVHNKTWLVEQALPEAVAEAWERALEAQAEFEFRKTAAHFLAQQASSALNEEEASKAHVSTQARVLCTTPLEAEAARLHVDREEFFAMADWLRARLLATQLWEYLSAHFGQTWWKEAQAGAWLKTLWEEGNALPAEFLVERATRPIEASSTPPSSR